jgi:hypothetical protein
LTLPTVTSFSPVNGSTIFGSAFSIVVNFSENVTGFTVADVVPSTGTVSSVSGGPLSYTVNFAGAAAGAWSFSIANNRVNDTAGNGNVASSASFSVSLVESISVAPSYPAFQDWNKYINITNPINESFEQPSPAVCTTGSMNRYEDCIHSGSLRETNVLSRASCSNLTAQDSADAFQWKCYIRGGHVKFVTNGFKSGKGLANLIDVTTMPVDPAFKQLSLTVIENGSTTIAQTSVASAWWGDNVELLPSSSSAVANLSTANKIYVVSSNMSGLGYAITADEIGFVAMPGFAFTQTGTLTSNCTFSVSSLMRAAAICIQAGRRFLWIEGNIDGGGSSGAHVAVAANSSRFVRLHRLSVYNITRAAGAGDGVIQLEGGFAKALTEVNINGCVYSALYMRNEYYALVKNFRASNCARVSANGSLVQLNVSHNNRFYNTILVNDRTTGTTGGGGFFVLNSNENSFVGGMISNAYSASGTDAGFRFNGASDNIISQMTISGMTNGIHQTNSSLDNIVTHSTLVNNSNRGIWINNISLAESYNHQHNSLAIINNDVGVFADGSAVTGQSDFYNSVIAHSTNVVSQTSLYSSIFDFHGAIGVNQSQSCAGSGYATDCGAGVFRVDTSSDIRNGFVGPLAMDGDLSNQSDNTNATPNYSVSLSWLFYDNIFRTFAKPMVSFLSMSDAGINSVRGDCAGAPGQCQISDWRLKNISSLFNSSFNFPAKNSNITNWSGFSCPVEVSGALFATNGIRNFLQHAVEISFDKIGNDNGICETDEACTYAPNVGSYQGEGNYFSQGTCTFSDGAISNVTMYRYPTYGL